MGLFFEILLPPFVACLVLTGIHTYLGLHVVSRGVIFVDLALAQIAAMGATFAFLLGYEPSSTPGYLYSLLFAFLGAAVFSLSRLKEQRIPQEAIIGITFAVASAASILIADRAPQGAEHVEAMLTGALLWVPWPKIVRTALIYAGIGVFHWYYRQRFLTISLDPDRARREGWNLRWWDFLFYMSFGFVITSSVSMAGILLVFSFLVIPSVIAMLFARRTSVRLAIGWVTGTVVSMVGLVLSYRYDLPSGPAVVCTFGGALILAAVVRYVWIAEARVAALAKVGAATLAMAAAGWLAVSTAAVPGAEAGHAAPSGAEDAAGEGDLDPVDRARAAVARLAQSPEAPPPDAVASMVSLQSELHRLIETGQLEVSEEAVSALARADADAEVSELLEEFAYHTPDFWVRLRAAQGLLDRGNVLGISALIELLDSRAPGLVKLQAAQALQEITGEEFGFDPDASSAAQDEAVRRWRAWWDDNRDREFPELDARASAHP